MSLQNELPATGFLRLKQIIGPRGPIPVSRSTWWAGVKDGRFPKPVKLGPNITAWRVSDIQDLIERLSNSEPEHGPRLLGDVSQDIIDGLTPQRGSR